jgi:predicted DNA binding protein
MDDGAGITLDAAELIEAVSGCVAVQVGAEFARANDGFAEMIGTDRSTLRGDPWRTWFDPRTVARIEDGIAEARSEGRWEARFDTAGGKGTEAGFSLTLSGTDTGAVVWTAEPLAGDERTATARGTVSTPPGERIIDSRHRLYPEAVDAEYRGILDRINDLLLETVGVLLRADGREAVESAVCERLAKSDLYRFAWVGERELAGDRVVPRTSAGRDHGYLEAIGTTDTGSDTAYSPAARAIRSGDVVATNIGAPAFEPWREAARERGIVSVAAVPFQHEAAVYGVLVVYTARGDAFTSREAAGLDVIGRTVGLVIHAAKRRDLLFADSVVELEFRIGDDVTPFAWVAADLDCELSLEGHVASGDRWILYLDVRGALPDPVVERLADEERVEGARTVEKGENEGRVEVAVTGSALLDTVERAGATVTAATVDGVETHLVVEAPGDADARDVVDQVRSEYPDATLLATRECDREIATAGRPWSVLDALTDRQHEVLEAAYRAGYYAWPRESTAGEVAASLDLTRPTLHGHLRKAENALLSQLLEGGR